MKKKGDVKGDLIVEGDLMLAGDLTVEKSIIVTGSIDCAGYSIEAGYSIKAGGSGGIQAGLSIKCKTRLSCGLNIFAGTVVWRQPTEAEKTITCGELGSGTVAYGTLNVVPAGKELD